MTKTTKTAAAAPAKSAAKPRTASGAKPAVAKSAAKSVSKAASKPAAKPEVQPEVQPELKAVDKAPAAEKAAAVAKPAQTQKDKPRKPKLVRDSFTMPEEEYQVLGEVKKACLKAGIEVKKSELLRVGVAVIRQMDLARLQEVLDTLPPLKPGRPKKNK